MSLTQALATSVAGLRTTQAGLAVIASNVANAETPGYIRKTMTPMTAASGGAGVSVRAGAINRELDQFIQRQLRVEASGGAYADMRAQFYARLQGIYGTPGSDSALETAFNNFTSAVQTLSTNPDTISARTAAVTAGQVLAQALNGMTYDIQSLRSDAEQGLSSAVQNANNAMSQIASINRQLATTSQDDATAATLRDQRDMYLDQLAQLMDIKVVAGERNQVTVFTNSGIQLVGTQASQLAFDAVGMLTPSAHWDSAAGERGVGTLTLVSPTGGQIDLIANKSIRSGEIAAFIEMRDEVLVGAQAQLDGIAAAMSLALSSRTVAGTPATALPQTGFDINVSGLLAGNSINLSYSDTPSNVQHRITIVRVDDPAALPLSDNHTNDPNDEVIGIDFSGGMASVVAQLNARFNGRIQFSDQGGGVLRIMDDGAGNTSNIDSVSSTQTATGVTGGGGELSFFTDAVTPYSDAIGAEGSQRLGYAGRITVNAALIADPSKLVMYQTGVAAGDSTRPQFIYDRLVNASLAFSADTGIGTEAAPFAGTLQSFLRQVLTQQGENASNAANLAEGQSVVVNALQQRMDDTSAVNIDQEMAHLLQLQAAYGANARVMSAVKDMIDTLLRM